MCVTEARLCWCCGFHTADAFSPPLPPEFGGVGASGSTAAHETRAHETRQYSGMKFGSWR